MDPAFADALSPVPHWCLRLKLDPFTLGHWFLLARYAPAFVDRESIEPPSLPVAVFICCQPWRKAARALNRWWVSPFCALWGFTCRRLDPAAEISKFQSYLSQSMSSPAVSVSVKQQSKIRGGQAPLGFWLLAVLLSEFGLSESEAMDMPITSALSLRAAHAEHLGQVELQSPISRRLRAALQTHRN